MQRSSVVRPQLGGLDALSSQQQPCKVQLTVWLHAPILHRLAAAGQGVVATRVDGGECCCVVEGLHGAFVPQRRLGGIVNYAERRHRHCDMSPLCHQGAAWAAVVVRRRLGHKVNAGSEKRRGKLL